MLGHYSYRGDQDEIIVQNAHNFGFLFKSFIVLFISKFAVSACNPGILILRKSSFLASKYL